MFLRYRVTYQKLLQAGIFVALIGVVMAQDSKTRDLKLAGDRFKPLTYETMTPEQRKMTDDVLLGDLRVHGRAVQCSAAQP